MKFKRVFVLASVLGSCAVGAQSTEEGVVRGVTRCVNDLSMSFAVSGRVAELAVKEGATVRGGQALSHLDRKAEAIDVERRKLQWQSRAEYDAAESRLKTALIQVQAGREIFGANRGISEEELQNKELAASLAKSEFERVKNVKKMEELDYQTAVENLERRTLKASGPGVITKILKWVGEGVQANEPAIRVCDISTLHFVVNAPMAQVGTLAQGDLAKLHIGNDKTQVQGRAIFVSPAVDAASGLREIKFELIKPPASVRPGMPGQLDLRQPSK